MKATNLRSEERWKVISLTGIPLTSLRVCARRNVNGGGISQKWFEFLNAGERIIAPWPKGEMIIAKALGTDPWIIWPSRYHDPQTHEFIDRTQLMRSYTLNRK